jgi:siderophore synthetase component
MKSSFQYGIIKNVMVQIVDQFAEADSIDEDEAMLSLRYTIGSRINTIDPSHETVRSNAWLTNAIQFVCLTQSDQPLLPVN